MNTDVSEQGPRQVEKREKIEIRCQPEVVSDGGGYQSTDQVRRDIASDVGGGCRCSVDSARMLAQICKCQCEGAVGTARIIRLTTMPSRRSICRLKAATTSPAIAIPSVLALTAEPIAAGLTP